jgi:hypothetical protein
MRLRIRISLRKAHGIGFLPIHVKKYPGITAGRRAKIIEALGLSFFALLTNQDDTEKKIVPNLPEIRSKILTV